MLGDVPFCLFLLMFLLLPHQGERAAKDLPPWMAALHCHVGDLAAPTNVVLFIVKLIINRPKVGG